MTKVTTEGISNRRAILASQPLNGHGADQHLQSQEISQPGFQKGADEARYATGIFTALASLVPRGNRESHVHLEASLEFAGGIFPGANWLWATSHYRLT